MNRGRPVFYFIILVSFSILFDFIQMIIFGQGPFYNTGAGVWSLLCAIVDFLLKFLIIYCSNNLFQQLGGTWSWADQFGAESTGGDAPYASIDGGKPDDIGYSYQAENDYQSPPTQTTDNL